MKKAFGFSALTFLAVAAAWALTRLVLTLFDGIDYFSGLTHPLALSLCGAAAIGASVFVFRKARRRFEKRAVLVIR